MTKEEIKNRYMELCGMVGDLNYRLQAIPKDLEAAYKEMLELNQANAKLQEEEKNYKIEATQDAAPTEKA